MNGRRLRHPACNRRARAMCQVVNVRRLTEARVPNPVAITITGRIAGACSKTRADARMAARRADFSPKSVTRAT